MIASSLRNCSLNGGGGRRRGRGRRHAAAADDDEGGDDSEGVTVELNSEVALPYHWEQCLDIRTGQVYYINWEDGTRTTVDPRSSAVAYSSSSMPRSAASSTSRRRSRARRAPSTTTSSGHTSGSSVGTSASGGNGYAVGDNGHVLVAAGCRACFMYFMVPKRADVCPKCGSSGLLHLSRNGYD
ncbi:hypothetical protein ABZP36_033192 [Zizania latifolia]